MEFIYKNSINTTSALTTTGGGSNTLEYLFDRNYNIGWSSSGFNDDNTSCTITFSFDATTSVDRLALMNHNLKGFRAFYNGATGNTFTPDINYNTNSDTNSYFQVTAVDCTSVTFQLDSTIVADMEKEIGELIITESGVSFERNPNASSYKPKLDRKSIDHKMSDGGIVQHIIADKFTARIKYKFVSESFYDDLKTFYDLSDPFIFVAFPTTTGWDGILYEVNWEGDWKLREYSSENIEAGYNIEIRLRETAT